MASTPSPEAPSDEQLAAAAQRGCHASWAMLTRRYEDRLLHFLWHRTPQPADAEDLCQETLLRAWRKIDQFDPARRFAAWLFTIAARLAVDAHRRRGNRPPSTVRETSMDPAPDKDPATALAEREAGRNLWAWAKLELTTDQYEATWLRYGETLTPDEIARVMGRSAVSIRVMLLRARRRLRKALETAESARTALGPGSRGKGRIAPEAPSHARAAAADPLRGMS